MRAELAKAVAGLFAAPSKPPRGISEAEIERIGRVIDLVVRLRAPVERDRGTRELEAVYGAEGAARIGLALERLLVGLDALGVEREHALNVVESVALDSVPPQRRQAYECVTAKDEGATTTEVAIALGLPTVTVRRVLEDLAAYGLIDRADPGQGKPHEWIKTDWETQK